MTQCWIVFCPEKRHPGLWARWRDLKCVAVGWGTRKYSGGQVRTTVGGWLFPALSGWSVVMLWFRILAIFVSGFPVGSKPFTLKITSGAPQPRANRDRKATSAGGLKSSGARKECPLLTRLSASRRPRGMAPLHAPLYGALIQSTTKTSWAISSTLQTGLIIRSVGDLKSYTLCAEVPTELQATSVRASACA